MSGPLADGRLAQLVARFLHTEEVISSSLVSPTKEILDQPFGLDDGDQGPVHEPRCRPLSQAAGAAQPRLPAMCLAAMRPKTLAGPIVDPGPG